MTSEEGTFSHTLGLVLAAEVREDDDVDVELFKVVAQAAIDVDKTHASLRCLLMERQDSITPSQWETLVVSERALTDAALCATSISNPSTIRRSFAMKPETRAGRLVIWSVWAWGAVATTFNHPARKRWDDWFPDWVTGRE